MNFEPNQLNINPTLQESRVIAQKIGAVCININKLCGLSPQAIYTDRLSDRRMSAKLVPTLADRGCRVVSAIIP
jgi:hypothetical protein